MFDKTKALGRKITGVTATALSLPKVVKEASRASRMAESSHFIKKARDTQQPGESAASAYKRKHMGDFYSRQAKSDILKEKAKLLKRDAKRLMP